MKKLLILLFLVIISLSVMLSLFFFFFSSRRRHTRCLSDWSSDVCSSDLTQLARLTGQSPRASQNLVGDGAGAIGGLGDAANIGRDFLGALGGLFDIARDRSEERRVGKECRSGWSTYD